VHVLGCQHTLLYERAGLIGVRVPLLRKARDLPFCIAAIGCSLGSSLGWNLGESQVAGQPLCLRLIDGCWRAADSEELLRANASRFVQLAGALDIADRERLGGFDRM
jgi:hypothetical protein